MLKQKSLAKITILLLSTAALGGIALAQSAPANAPAWPEVWTKPATATAQPGDPAAEPLAVLDQPFEAPAGIDDPLMGDSPANVTDPLLDPAPMAEAPEAAADPLADIEGLTVPEEMPDYISDPAPAPAPPDEPSEPAPAPVDAQQAAAPAQAAPVADPVLVIEEPQQAAAIRIAPSGGNGVSVNTQGAAHFADGSSPDPVTAEAEALVRDSGLIARQSDMGEGLLLMDRQLRFAEAVNQMIGIMGPDVEIEVAPGVYQRYGDTPAGRKAQLEMKRLEQEAEFANLDFQLQLREREAKLLEATKSPEGEKSPDGLLPLRSDGGEFQDLSNAAPQGSADPLAGIDPAVVAALSERITAEVQAAMPAPEPVAEEAAVPTFSLREIFGSGSEFVAVLGTGSERIRVRTGDDLPGGVKVLAVGEDFVELETDGVPTRLSIRG